MKLHPILDKQLGNILSRSWDGIVIDQFNILAYAIENMNNISKETKNIVIHILIMLNDKQLKQFGSSITSLKVDLIEVILNFIPGISKESFNHVINDNNFSLVKDLIIDTIISF